MIANLTAGNKVKFQYIDRVRDYSVFPTATSYDIDTYEGTVVDVRDISIDKLSRETVARHPEVERSRYLVTIQLSDNKIKSFYDGRVVNIKKINKNFISRLVDKLTGK
jgi:hypothetical protein